MIRRLLTLIFGDGKPPIRRSPKWPGVRAQHLKAHPACEVCGTRDDCEVHHIWPVHVYPQHELDLDRLITLCPDHHLLVGHLMNWRSWNSDVVQDAKDWRRKIGRRPMAYDTPEPRGATMYLLTDYQTLIAAVGTFCLGVSLVTQKKYEEGIAAILGGLGLFREWLRPD